MKKPGHLFCRVSHHMDFVDCIPMVKFNKFLCPLFSTIVTGCIDLVVSRGLFVSVMWSLVSSVHSVVAEMRQIHMDSRVLWKKRDGTATLSRGECPSHSLKRRVPQFLPWQAFIGLICIRTQGAYGKLISHCQAVRIKQ